MRRRDSTAGEGHVLTLGAGATSGSLLPASVSALAVRAPVEPPAGELSVAHRLPTPRTSLSCPLVDREAPLEMVSETRPSVGQCRCRAVGHHEVRLAHLVLHGEDLREEDTQPQEVDEIRPDELPRGPSELRAQRERVGAVTVQNLAAIDVPHSCKH